MTNVVEAQLGGAHPIIISMALISSHLPVVLVLLFVYALGHEDDFVVIGGVNAVWSST